MLAPARNCCRLAVVSWSVMAGFGLRARADAGFEDGEGEPGRAGGVVGIGVRDVAGERDGVVDLEDFGVVADVDGDSAFADLEDFLGAGYVGLAVMPVSGRQGPVPQLEDVGLRDWTLAPGDRCR